MAQTSSAFSGIPNAQYTRLYLDFWVASQSTANNQTTFGYKLVIGGVDGGAGSTQGGAYTFSNAWSASASGLTWSWSTSSHKTIREGTFVVTHNADGTLSNRTLTAAASFVTYDGTATASTSVTISVPTIPRYAAITAFTVSINDRSATLSWTADKTISQWRWSSNSGSSYSGWTTVNAKSGSTSLSVSPGSSYGFRIQVINSASGLITTSSVVSKTATKTPSTLTLGTTSQNVGSGITWTINEANESYGYTHKITYFFGSTSGYILGSDTNSPNTLTGTWTVPTSLANQIPNATSGSGVINVYTYYDGRRVGKNSYTFTAKVPNTTTWQPAIPNVTIKEAVTQPTGITSYVQGKSRANVVSSSTGRGGASISSYRVIVSDIGTYYGANVTSGYLTKSGTVTITVRATDSRGYYREKASKITVVAYSPPKLTTYTAMRSPNDQGTNLATSINFSISSVSSQNTKQYRIRYRPTDETWVSLVDSTGYYTRSTTHSATGALDANSSYEVEFYIKDSYTSVTQIRHIGTAFQLLDFNASGRGMAIGKVSEKDAFEVALPVEFNSVDFTMPNGRLAVYLQNLYDLNDVVEEWILGANGSNYPSSGYWYVHTIMYANSTHRKQIAYGYINNDVYTRHLYDGTWSAWVKPIEDLVAAHEAESANPHGVTKSQVGLGSVGNYALATKAEAEAGTSNAKYMTPLRVKEAINANNAIVESGSNSQGAYIKYDDGTMECYQKLIRTAAANAVVTYSWYYPATFKSGTRPTVSLTPGTSSGAAANGAKLRSGLSGGSDGQGPTHTDCACAIQNLDTSNREVQFHLKAIGRWK